MDPAPLSLQRAAKIIDVCDIVPVGEHVAIVGHAMNKNALAAHLAGRILGQAITITDISELNDVFIDVGDSEIPPDATVHTSFFGRMFIVPIKHNWQATWTMEQWNEHRISNLIPYHGHEISSTHHPLHVDWNRRSSPKGMLCRPEVLTRMRSRGKQGHHLVVQSNPVENRQLKAKNAAFASSALNNQDIFELAFVKLTGALRFKFIIG